MIRNLATFMEHSSSRFSFLLIIWHISNNRALCPSAYSGLVTAQVVIDRWLVSVPCYM